MDGGRVGVQVEPGAHAGDHARQRGCQRVGHAHVHPVRAGIEAAGDPAADAALAHLQPQRARHSAGIGIDLLHAG